MKRNWQRGAEFLVLDTTTLNALIEPAFPGRKVEDARPVDGGLSNTNYRLLISGRDSPVRLRIFVTRPESAALEAALCAYVRPRVPVPLLLYHALANPFTGHPYAVMEWLEGIALDDLPALAGPHELALVAHQIGAVLAEIGAFKFASAGFLDSALEVARPMHLDGAIFRSYIERDLVGGQAEERLGRELSRELCSFVTAASPILDDLDEVPCLVHGDFDGSNILVHRADDQWRVSGVVDWEYAIAATPLVDLGHILRPPFGDIESFEHSLIEGFQSHGGVLARQWKRACRLLDLINWVSFLNRPAPGSQVIESSREMIVRTISSW
jgi:aminoglycoside phosphotransferase (APT) family kinase protein